MWFDENYPALVITILKQVFLISSQEMLPLVQQFHNSHNRLVDWMMEAESQLQVAEPREEDIARLELDIQG